MLTFNCFHRLWDFVVVVICCGSGCLAILPLKWNTIGFFRWLLILVLLIIFYFFLRWFNSIYTGIVWMNGDFGMSLCLHSFVKDIVRQIFDSNEWLDQRHYRLLLNLPAIEKVHFLLNLICIVIYSFNSIHFFHCHKASISKINFGIELERGQPDCYEILTKIEYFKYVRCNFEHIQSESRRCSAHFKWSTGNGAHAIGWFGEKCQQRRSNGNVTMRNIEWRFQTAVQWYYTESKHFSDGLFDWSWWVYSRWRLFRFFFHGKQWN